jgi:hypothetical protein
MTDKWTDRQRQIERQKDILGIDGYVDRWIGG